MEKDLRLPDLTELVEKAIPFDDRDSIMVKESKQRKRANLSTAIKEFAELYHLTRLKEPRIKKNNLKRYY